MQLKSVLLTLTLGLGLGTAFALPTLPSDATYDAVVTLRTGANSDRLAPILQALGKSVGLTVVTEGVPDKNINFDISGKTFRDVWGLLISVNDLDYEVLNDGIVLVGPTSVVQKVRKDDMMPVDTKGVKGERRFYTINTTVADVLSFLKAEIPAATYNPVPNTKIVSITATAAQHSDIVALLARVDVGTPTAEGTTATPTERRFYTVNSNVADVVGFLKTEMPQAAYTPVANSQIVAITASAAQHEDIVNLLKKVDPAPTEVVTTNKIPTERRFYTIKSSVADVLSFLKTEMPTVVYTTVPNGRDIAVTATSAQHSDIEALLKKADVVNVAQVSETAVVQQIFRLSYAKAADIKGTLESTVKSAGTGTTDKTAEVKAAEPSTLSIVADDRTNTLIVRGTSAQVKQVSELLTKLDVRVPRINVQVRIQEVTKTASDTLGLDWSAGAGNFTTKLISGNFSGLFDFTKSLAGLNVGAALTALEKQGLTKRVDDANIMLQSGQKDSAIIKSGGTYTIVGSAASTSATGELKLAMASFPYGVSIEVKNPQVNADGTISFDVDSSVQDPKGASGNNVDQTNRQAKTTISLKSGETVLMGGLLSSKDSVTYMGVPILMDIPVVGNLFKTTNTTSDNTQLMFVVTANTVE